MTTELTTTQPKENYKAQALRRWVQRLAWALIIIGPLIFIMAGLGSRFGLWDWRFGLGPLTRNIGPKVLMLTILIGFLSLILTFVIRPRKGLLVSVLALIIPIAGLLNLNAVKKKGQKLPVIHDITTDTQNPPVFTDVILSDRNQTPKVNTVDYIGKKDRPGGKLVSVLQTKSYPDIRTLVLSSEPDVAFGEAKAAAKSLGWAIQSDDVSKGIIEATDTTFWYGFKDDVVIRIKAAEGGGSIVDIRSVSRVGRSDLGANAARIRKFMARMRED